MNDTHSLSSSMKKQWRITPVGFVCIVVSSILLFSGCATDNIESALPISGAIGTWSGPSGIICLVVADSSFFHFQIKEPFVDNSMYVEYWLIRNDNGDKHEEVFFLNRRGKSIQGLQSLEWFIPRNNLSSWSLSIVQYNRSRPPSDEDTGLRVDKTVTHKLSEIVSEIGLWHQGTGSLFVSEKSFDDFNDE